MATEPKTEPKNEAKKVPPPPPPIKKYRVLEEFVSQRGQRFLKTPDYVPPPPPEQQNLIDLSEEDAKQALEDGVVEEVIISPAPQGAGVAPKVPPHK